MPKHQLQEHMPDEEINELLKLVHQNELEDWQYRPSLYTVIFELINQRKAIKILRMAFQYYQYIPCQSCLTYCDKCEKATDEFEQKTMKSVCELIGHEVIADQCNKPEHDFCMWCEETRPGESSHRQKGES